MLQLLMFHFFNLIIKEHGQFTFPHIVHEIADGEIFMLMLVDVPCDNVNRRRGLLPHCPLTGVYITELINRPFCHCVCYSNSIVQHYNVSVGYN